MTSRYPRARRDPVVDQLNGHRVTDPYRWLEDGESAECAAWLADQAKLYERHAKSWSRRDHFRASLVELTRNGSAAATNLSPPVSRGDRRFFLSRQTGQELPVLVVGGSDGGQSVLVDPMALDPTGTTLLDGWRPSWSGDALVYQLSRRGSEQPAMWVLDVRTGEVIDGPLRPGRATSVAWLSDDTGFYYIATRDDGSRRQVRLHRLGDDPGHDAVVFDTERAQLSVKVSRSGRWLMVSTSTGATSGNTLHLSDLSTTAPEAPVLRRVFDGGADRERAVLKFGSDDLIYAVTDADAPLGRVCVVDGTDPGYRAWRTIVAEEPGAVLNDCVPLTDPNTGTPCLLISRTRDGVGELAVYDGQALIPVGGPGPGTIAGLTAQVGGAQAWFTYSNFVTAPVLYRFSLRDRACTPERPADEPAAAPIRATVRRVTYHSHDGTAVSMYLITPTGDARACPTILTAYGGFGASYLPAYSPTILAWVLAGGAYAIANVRGGGEQGTTWHAAGSGGHKPNTFADVAAAAEWLLDAGWTTPRQLAIRGASHSGLVAAAALTQHPERYAAVVCSDAVLDMTRYHRFGLGQLWTEEFGVADDPTQLATLLSYSPYHNIRQGTPYPAVLFTCARTDPRVDSMHTRKMTAAVQHATTSDRPVLLRAEADVGHGRRSVSRWIDLQADTLAFCATHTGLAEPGAPAS